MFKKKGLLEGSFATVQKLGFIHLCMFLYCFHEHHQVKSQLAQYHSVMQIQHKPETVQKPLTYLCSIVICYPLLFFSSPFVLGVQYHNDSWSLTDLLHHLKSLIRLLGASVHLRQQDYKVRFSI